MRVYNLDIRISKQEDGLWRVEVPALQGCFVDESVLSRALDEIQPVAAMILDLMLEEGKALPPGCEIDDELVVQSKIPVIIEEHEFRRVSRSPKKSGKAAARDLPRP